MLNTDSELDQNKKRKSARGEKQLDDRINWIIGNEW